VPSSELQHCIYFTTSESLAGVSSSKSMEKSGVCSDSTNQAWERRVSFDRKTKCVKVPQTVVELLAELASLRLQTPEFFMRERGLCGKGLNPKLAVDMACVTPEKIEEYGGNVPHSRLLAQLLIPRPGGTCCSCTRTSTGRSKSQTMSS
jgi:hypothetical protein